MKWLLVLLYYSVFSTPIQIVKGELNSGRVYLPCYFENKQDQCFFDSGSSFSSIIESKFSKALKKTGVKTIDGASGKKLECHTVQVKAFGIPNVIEKSNSEIYLCSKRYVKENVIGNDILYGHYLSLQFLRNRFLLLESFNDICKSESFYREKNGLIIIPIKMNSQTLDAVWDTGAGLTTVDINYIKNHPKQFYWLKDLDNGVDSLGHKVKLSLFKMKDIKIAQYRLANINVLAMDFSKLKVHTKLPNFILGYNIISKFNWNFDFIGNFWQIDNFNDLE